MAIAMKDLEIRGTGNLLGGEQSGHIADVGFDLYVRLVGEAVHEFRGDGVEEPAEVKIELPIDAHLPHDYVPSERHGWRCTSGWPRCARPRTSPDPRGDAGPLRRAARAGVLAAGRRPVPGAWRARGS